ncbi:proline--tRNA ligase [Candidatus Dependentiae bacterium]|nr:proline--tRNA ligase [Candidatus Dependentiae bacterium]
MSTLPDINTHFAEWYQEIIAKTGIVDSSPTRGCFVIKPYGYTMWELIQQHVDAKIKALEVENAYFPLLIPKSFLSKEEKHVEGFSPELAVVTHGGGKELEEPLVVRPTSETIIYYMFSRWITSYRDLPLKINQWANVVRWEMRTRPFVRSLEFLWQEGHTAHRTHAEAVEMSLAALEMYRSTYEDFLAIPVVTGVKSESERFAGAERTYTVEGLMQDGRGLQMCTSHVLAHSFPEAFDVHFQDADGATKVPYCTSWGFTTRSIGAIIMTHGDAQGLVLPPKVAPIQVILVPIYKTDEERGAVVSKIKQLHAVLLQAGIRAKIDDREGMTPGAKYFEWEEKGVPVRLECGPKDLQNNTVVLANRIEHEKAKKKSFVPAGQVVEQVQALLQTIQTTMYERAKIRMQSQWHQVDRIADFGPKMETEQGWYQTGWCQAASCEAVVKQYKGTIRCLLEEKKHNNCFACGAASTVDILVAKAY